MDSWRDLDWVIELLLLSGWHTVTDMKSDAMLLVYTFVLSLQGRTIYFWIDLMFVVVLVSDGLEISELLVQIL
jgi:hypothetical protein